MSGYFDAEASKTNQVFSLPCAASWSWRRTERDATRRLWTFFAMWNLALRYAASVTLAAVAIELISMQFLWIICVKGGGTESHPNDK